jgi:hypothetical protein
VQLQLSDPRSTERLASFLESLGQVPTVLAPGRIELEGTDEAEVEIYLRVWRVLNPGVEVQVER